MKQQHKEVRLPSAEQREAAEKFEALNRFVMSRNGWVTSPPGDRTVRIETLPGSALPDELRQFGYRVTPAGEGERILPTGITERLTRRGDGVLEALVHGSTRPIVTVTHAGICKVERFEAIPPPDLETPIKIPGTRKPKPPRAGRFFLILAERPSWSFRATIQSTPDMRPARIANDDSSTLDTRVQAELGVIYLLILPYDGTEGNDGNHPSVRTNRRTLATPCLSARI